jgi:hypothetical protein
VALPSIIMVNARLRASMVFSGIWEKMRIKWQDATGGLRTIR